MAGKGVMADMWSKAKINAQKLANSNGAEKKAMENQIKSFKKGLGAELDKAESARKEKNVDKFDKSSAKVKSIAKGYYAELSQKIKDKQFSKKSADSLSCLLSAGHPESFCKQLDHIKLGSVGWGKESGSAFSDPSPQLNAKWLGKSVLKHLQTGAYTDFESGFRQLEHFDKGRASFYPKDLARLLQRYEAFASQIRVSKHGPESLKTLAKLKKLIASQAGAAAKYEKNTKKKADDKIAKIMGAVDKQAASAKTFRDQAYKLEQIVNTLYEQVDTAVNGFNKLVLPDKRESAKEAAEELKPKLERVIAAASKLDSKQPSTEKIQKAATKAYERGATKIPAVITAALTKLDSAINATIQRISDMKLTSDKAIKKIDTMRL